MIAVNIILMSLIAVGIVSLLSWAIVSDRRSHRTAGGDAPPSPRRFIVTWSCPTNSGRDPTGRVAAAGATAAPRTTAAAMPTRAATRSGPRRPAEREARGRLDPPPASAGRAGSTAVAA